LGEKQARTQGEDKVTLQRSLIKVKDKLHGDWWSIRNSARQFSIVKWAMALGGVFWACSNKNKFNECMMNLINFLKKPAA
jgi:hypothetical protein